MRDAIPDEIMKEARAVEQDCVDASWTMVAAEARKHNEIAIARALMARDKRAAEIAFAAMFTEVDAFKALALSKAILTYGDTDA